MAIALPRETPPISSVMEALDQRKGKRWAVGDARMMWDITEIIEDIVNGTAVRVSDGSFKDKFGIASWII